VYPPSMMRCHNITTVKQNIPENDYWNYPNV
jgi:hypothetical protein